MCEHVSVVRAFAVSGGAWTLQEKETLKKALIKIPNGSCERWSKVADMLPGRTAAEVARMVKDGLNDRPKVDSLAPSFVSKAPIDYVMN